MALTHTPAILLAAVGHQIQNAIKFASVGGVLNCAHSPGVLDESFGDAFIGLVRQPNRLTEMSNRWRGLVDAYGIERLTSIIMERVRRGT